MHLINIVLDPHDGATRIALEALDYELGEVSAPERPGLILAQVIPHVLTDGTAPGVTLKACVLDHDTGLKIRTLKDAAT